MLVQADVARYLLQKGLTTAESLVDGDVQIVEASSRNQNWKVIDKEGRSYFLKQGVGAVNAKTVSHEAAIYEQLLADAANRHHGHLPNVFEFDRDQGILVLELLGDAENFRDYHARGRFSKACGVGLGEALSEIHIAAGSEFMRSAPGSFHAHLPWALGIHRPDLSIFRDASRANLQLIRIVQNTSPFPQILDELRQQWRVDGLIHNDIKWDNCLLQRGSGWKRRRKISIVDWEFAGFGDRCWDAGAIFASYLNCWLDSIPITGEDPPDRFLDLAKFPLEKMQPAICAYWHAYAEGMQLKRRDIDDWLFRSVRYAGARLVQTGFEKMQHSTRLTGNLICLLQLSLNIMQRPRETAAQLLGIVSARRQGESCEREHLSCPGRDGD